jgi:hypothetical protein
MSTTTYVQEGLEEEPLDLKGITDKEKQELIHAETASITSGTTLGETETEFKAIKALNISAKGIPVFRWPVPSSELQINIYNQEGTIAYQSTRALRSSGNSVLTDQDGKELIATEYFFGPSRDPILHILGGEENSSLRTVSKWTSRSQTFLLPDGRKFTWEYKKERGFGAGGEKATGLVLTLQGKRVAVLLRNDETRTLGSKSCSAGNGGALLLGDAVDAKEGVSEELVVATCLMMLKKEVDRRRALQIAGLVSVL